MKRAATEATLVRAREDAGLPRPAPRTPEGPTGGQQQGLNINQRRYWSAIGIGQLVQNHGPMPHMLQVRS
jgi:hypothetical protein